MIRCGFLSFCSSAKANLIASALAEEQLHAQAAKKIASDQIRRGLWAKLLQQRTDEGIDDRLKSEGPVN